MGCREKALALKKLFHYFYCTYISLGHFTGKMGKCTNIGFKYFKLLYLKNISIPTSNAFPLGTEL